MARVVLLDSGPLGEVTHPESEKRGPIREWLFRLLDAGAYPRLPEIVDYEHRRALLHRDASRQVERLNRFKQVFGYEPLTTEVMLVAAELWADARKRGLPTGTERELDVDVYPWPRRHGHFKRMVTGWSWRPRTLATLPASWMLVPGRG